MKGRWLVATTLLGRQAPAGEPYPHICGITMEATRRRERYRLTRRDCPACADRSG
ncbi:hypothetical protein [Micromonospora craniellae]|uniref:hypothetical protein n=1 Tax=Micromonospora craniellae TaxID=2294034 RepID=UPI00131455E1|nr:hypothetical protein [Micromonospora craniellae]QOC89860.1 hypothetical protein ID554_16615 [Micromonospora craniellae]